jgi:DNA invertase Pin-like site-specific DNA recombinase
MVSRIERLERSIIDLITTVIHLRNRGIGVRCLSDGIDPSTRGNL